MSLFSFKPEQTSGTERQQHIQETSLGKLLHHVTFLTLASQAISVTVERVEGEGAERIFFSSGTRVLGEAGTPEKQWALLPGPTLEVAKAPLPCVCPCLLHRTL